MKLLLELKRNYKKANINQKDSSSVEITFKAGSDPIIIIEEGEVGKYSIQYPELKKSAKGKHKTEFVSAENILIEGVHWILKQVERNGMVRPDF